MGWEQWPAVFPLYFQRRHSAAAIAARTCRLTDLRALRTKPPSRSGWGSQSRCYFVGGSEAPNIMRSGEAALVHLCQEKRARPSQRTCPATSSCSLAQLLRRLPPSGSVPVHHTRGVPTAFHSHISRKRCRASIKASEFKAKCL
jgi:hypothetical protein